MCIHFCWHTLIKVEAKLLWSLKTCSGTWIVIFSHFSIFRGFFTKVNSNGFNSETFGYIDPIPYCDGSTCYLLQTLSGFVDIPDCVFYSDSEIIALNNSFGNSPQITWMANRPNSQIALHTSSISHSASFRKEICTFTNRTIHISHIPQCIIQKRNLHIHKSH